MQSQLCGRHRQEDCDLSLTLGKNVRSYLKNKAKRGGCITQVIECLPKKHWALISNLNPPKRKKIYTQSLSQCYTIYFWKNSREIIHSRKYYKENRISVHIDMYIYIYIYIIYIYIHKHAHIYFLPLTAYVHESCCVGII
jgi:hypothetical protein